MFRPAVVFALALAAVAPAHAGPKEDLHNAFTKFLAQTSFRGTMASTMAGKATTSTVEFVAPDRYRVDTGMTRSDRPFEKKVRLQRRARSLKMIRAVFRQRMADYRRLERAEPAVLGAMAARLRDAESRLAYHEAPGELFSRRRPGSVVEALRAAYGEARMEFLSSLKARVRALLHG